MRMNDEKTYPLVVVKKHEDFYKRLRARVRCWFEAGGRSAPWAEYVLLAPDLFHVMCRLMLDEQVPRAQKLRLAAAVAYFISPVDLLPEALLGPVGLLDDVVLAAYVLHQVVNHTDEAVLRRHWGGEQDVLRLVQDILKMADRILGERLWKRLRQAF